MINYPNVNMPRKHTKMMTSSAEKLFLLIVLFTTLPFIDIPFIGLSITAPLVYFLTLELIFRKSRKGVKVTGWILCLSSIAIGVFLSSFVTGFSDREAGFSKNDLVFLIRYTYWILTGYVTLKVMSKRPELGENVVRVAVAGAFILVLCRWFEGVFWGKVGAWSHTKILTENTYAFIFSTFGPMFIAMVIQVKGRKRLFYITALVLLWGAIFINGSRSCWITTAFALTAFIAFRYLVNPLNIKTYIKIAAAIIVLLVGLAVSFQYMPTSVKESFMARFSTMEDLENDKSYQIRVLMRQKAVKVFKEHPIFGCGPARFKQTDVYLDIPPVLRYGGQETFMRRSAHNSWLQFLAETGLVGNIPFYIFLFLITFKGFFSVIRLARQKINWPMGVYVGFLAMSIHMYTLSGITNTHVWMMYALVASLISLDKAIRRTSIVHA